MTSLVRDYGYSYVVFLALLVEEDLVFRNLLPEMKTDAELQFYCKVFAHLTKKPQAVVLKWQDDHHPKKPDQELCVYLHLRPRSYFLIRSVLDNSLLFCQSRECWHYCCSTHDEPIQPPEAPVYPKPAAVARKQTVPCGPHCFRHLGTERELVLAPTQWTEKDKKLTARLVQQFGDDPCLIGVLLQKPCAHLHTLMPSLPKLEGVAPQPVTERMRKKRRALALAHSVSAAEQQHSYIPCKHSGRLIRGERNASQISCF